MWKSKHFFTRFAYLRLRFSSSLFSQETSAISHSQTSSAQPYGRVYASSPNLCPFSCYFSYLRSLATLSKGGPVCYAAEPVEEADTVTNDGCEDEGFDIDQESTCMESGKKLNISEKANLLVKKLGNVNNSREAVYETLNAWIAREPVFPLAALKRALNQLERQKKWHRIVQVIKWMLSRGQGMTMETYLLLVCALENDNRVEEAHAFWEKRIGINVRSVPWKFCSYMIDMYERHNMPHRLVKVFRDIEMCNRKPPNQATIDKVARAYKLLGLDNASEKVLQKYVAAFDSSNSKSWRQRRGKKSSNDATETDGDTKRGDGKSGDSPVVSDASGTKSIEALGFFAE